jgi:hypothetical protein
MSGEERTDDRLGRSNDVIFFGGLAVFAVIDLAFVLASVVNVDVGVVVIEFEDV